MTRHVLLIHFKSLLAELEREHICYLVTVTDKLSESINTIANEPSVAFYRIQEHVRKTLPQLVEQKVVHDN